ncbi:phage holin family protein [Pseudomonas sp. EL_65y_Pfl2_R95]|uniref:phage holin family protein n=1 Tax=Pseudomonas sp. EL_65y_Pfl2_R95 TaxID=3088698 RepID=UPI0030DAFDD8
MEAKIQGNTPSPRRLAGALMGLLHGHVALFAEELKEQQSHAVHLLLLTSLSLVFGLLLVIGLSAALLICFWDDYRIPVIIGLCVFYSLALIVSLVTLINYLRNAPIPFSASLDELVRDREQLLP